MFAPLQSASRPLGRALVVGSASGRTVPLEVLERLGFACSEADDAYAAMVELCQRPLAYAALICCLQSFYVEELDLIRTCKTRFPHLVIWLTQTDGRQGTVAEAMRRGADGLLDRDGLHPVATERASDPAAGAPVARDLLAAAQVPADMDVPPELRPRQEPTASAEPGAGNGKAQHDSRPGVEPPEVDRHSMPLMVEPILTADELRALLQEQPSGSTDGGHGEPA